MSRDRGHPANWTSGLRRAAQLAAAYLLVVALVAVLHRGRREPKWRLAQGTIQDTRIVADHALQTAWGGQITWKAEYMITYSVAGRGYVIWADSGIRGDSESDVRLHLPQSRPPCRVEYDSKRPEVSVADCR